MNVLYVMGMGSSKYGGLERHIVKVVQLLQCKGHKLFTVWETCPANQQFISDVQAAGGTVHVIPSRVRSVQFFLKIFFFILKNKINIFHGHFNPASLLALLAARFAFVPFCVQTMHSGLPEITNLSKKSRISYSLRYHLAHVTFCVSGAIMAQLKGLGLVGKSEVFYIGTSKDSMCVSKVQRVEFGLGVNDFVVACVSFHAEVKGVDVLLRAVALLADRCPHLRLLQIGGGQDAAYTRFLKHLARDLDIEDRVIWAGLRDDVPRILKLCDCYCQPSRSEGVPLAILEAMQAGLPVVASNVGGIPEAVIDGVTGTLVEPDSSIKLANEIETVISCKDLRQSYSQSGRRRVIDCFDMNSQAEKLIISYQNHFIG